tara:strand:+ start:949 stop:1509 length:561 start_codon:yes stop_codon:yes gene_type:complete
MITQNLPNVLTILRIVLSPFFILFMINDFLVLSFLLMFLISVTDFLDGYLARKYDLVTDLGKYLDPLADKVFILTVFFTLYFILGNSIFPLWMILLIFLRDFFITIMRNFLKSNQNNFKTSRLAKNKTLIQIICMHFIIFILILDHYLIANIDYSNIYYIMFFCTLITLISGFDYIYQYYFKKNDE